MKKDKGHFSEKHPTGRKPNPDVSAAVKKRGSSGALTCAQAFDIAKDLNVPPEEVGFTMDCLEIVIARCQLGLFGYSPVRRIVKPAESVEPALEKAIRNALVDTRLPCVASWKIAKGFRTARIKVSSACETLKIKISSCQLGAF
jgi:hypothetical protein